MDQNLLQLCLIKLISPLQVIQLTTDTYQGRNQVIFRAPFSKTAHFDPLFSLFCNQVRQKTKQMDRNLLQLCLIKLISLLQMIQLTTDTYQVRYYVIFRSPASKTAHFGPKFSPFCNQARQKTKQMDQNMLQLCLIKLIYPLQGIQVSTDTYQGRNQVIFRCP